MDYRSNSTDSPAASSQVELSNFSNYNEKSSVSELNCRKRKAVCGGKLSKADRSTSAKENKAKRLAAEPRKDYIRVRARRGQATDRHSLAERVRREKISQRMKLLQDLVPGCDKVSGEAAMLDEIINYVESLQRQVQFLSMKLASVDPGLDFNLGNVPFKNIYQQSAKMPQNMCHLGSSAAAAAEEEEELYNHHTTVFNGTLSKCSVEPLKLDAKLCNKLGLQLPSFGGFCEILTHDFEDDLQRIVRMGSGHNSVNITGNYNRVKFQNK